MSALVPVSPAHGGPPERPGRTLADLVPVFCGWFRTMRGAAENTVKAYGESLSAFARFCASADVTRPEAVSFQLVEMYLATLTERRGLKATSANRHLHAIRSFFKFLRRDGHTSGNPADDVFSLKTPKRLPRRLSIPQQERLLAHLAQSESLEGRRTYALVATALFCGLRVEELATLRLDHVDLEAGRLRVVGKGDKERELPIVPRLAAILREYIEQIRPRLVAVKVRGSIYRDSGHRVWQMSYRVNGERFSKSTHTSDAAEARRILADCVRDLTIEQESPYLFVRAAVGHVKRRRGKPLLTRTIFHIISTQISPVVGQPINPYQFRHSFASRLRENGPPLELIQEALGHADLRTTLIYAQISSKKRHEDLARYLEGGR